MSTVYYIVDATLYKAENLRLFKLKVTDGTLKWVKPAAQGTPIGARLVSKAQAKTFAGIKYIDPLF